MDEAAVVAAHLLPLLAIALEIDRERVPLLLLPVAVERLRVVEMDVGHRVSARKASTAATTAQAASVHSSVA